METTILAVMVSLAALGLAVLGVVWRALDGRMNSLDRRMDRLERGREDRIIRRRRDAGDGPARAGARG